VLRVPLTEALRMPGPVRAVVAAGAGSVHAMYTDR
jgi:hypothetical protein